jgi:hypothetical protein
MEYQRVVVVTDSQQLVKLWDGSGHRSAGCHIMQEMKLLAQLASPVREFRLQFDWRQANNPAQAGAHCLH